MVTDEDAQKAVAQFHQYVLDGRALVVNEARPKTPGGGRSFASAGRVDFGDDFGRGSREPRW
jgi:RNA recognition motif-containing protein